MNGPRCQSCGAQMQLVRRNGKDEHRCPWTKPGQPELYCGRPFVRLVTWDQAPSGPPRSKTS